MPAMLAREDEGEWLDPKTPMSRLKELLRPYPSELLDARGVSPRVGSSTVDEPSLRDRAANAQGDLFG
jgi:putative SOS response-associated peptidase YedK